MTWQLLQKVLRQDEVDLSEATLLLARYVAYPDLDIVLYRDRFDALTTAAREAIFRQASAAARAEALANFLFVQQGFTGNTLNYSDPRNSFLCDVLERRLGIPISLSVLYIIIARRLGIPAHGVGLPGHFVVGIEDEVGTLWLDPFNEGVWLSEEDCQRLVRNTAGIEPHLFQTDWLQPTAVHDILIRMLNNLRLVYMQRQNWDTARRVVRLLRLLQPQAVELWRDEGLIELQRGHFARAVGLLETYLQKAPAAPDKQIIQEQVGPTINRWVQLN